MLGSFKINVIVIFSDNDCFFCQVYMMSCDD